MAETQYIVLRSQSPIIPANAELGAGARSRARRAVPEIMEVEAVALTKAERDDLRRDPRTRAIAEPMPMKLIAPVDVDAPATAAATNVTWGVEAVRAPESPFTGAGITVAVLDTGIDPNHPAFQGVNLVRRNFTTESADDLNGHGTHVAGTIFGQDVNDLRIGIAQHVSRALIGKVLGAGGGSSVSIAQAILWAVNEGAHVVSMSLGIDFPGFVKILRERGLELEPATSIALEAYRANVNLFTELADFVSAGSMLTQGTVIVAASGNESRRPTYEIAVAPPAAGTGILAIGALQQGATGLSVANFSNTQVNLSGPGVGVFSAFPGGSLRSLNGTSMATPHVAGVGALWAQRQLEATGQVDGLTLMAQIIASGSTAPLAANSEVEDVGTGIVQAPLS